KKTSYNITSFLQTYSSIFKTTIFESIILYNHIISNNTNTTITVNEIFNTLDILSIFKTNEERIDSYLKVTLKKLSEYLEQNKNKKSLFSKYDINKDGFLSKNEFLNVLKTFNDINESQQILILKLAD